MITHASHVLTRAHFSEADAAAFDRDQQALAPPHRPQPARRQLPAESIQNVDKDRRPRGFQRAAPRAQTSTSAPSPPGSWTFQGGRCQHLRSPASFARQPPNPQGHCPFQPPGFTELPGRSVGAHLPCVQKEHLRHPPPASPNPSHRSGGLPHL